MIEGLKRVAAVLAAIAIFVVVAALIWILVGWILAVVVTAVVVVLVLALFNAPVRFDPRSGRFVSRHPPDGDRWDGR